MKRLTKNFIVFSLAAIIGVLFVTCGDDLDDDNPFIGTWIGLTTVDRNNGSGTLVVTATTWTFTTGTITENGTYKWDGNTVTLIRSGIVKNFIIGTGVIFDGILSIAFSSGNRNYTGTFADSGDNNDIFRVGSPDDIPYTGSWNGNIIFDGELYSAKINISAASASNPNATKWTFTSSHESFSMNGSPGIENTVNLIRGNNSAVSDGIAAFSGNTLAFTIHITAETGTFIRN